MAKSTLPTYEQHPLALELMPGGMSDEEFGAFCDDVAERGIIFPITLFEGKVLDGWHRYRAGHKTGTRFEEIEYKGKDPAGYIAACNVMRRKLSSLQRAYVAAKIHRDHNQTQREVCKRFGISNEVLTLVLRAIDSRNTRLLKKIESDSDFTRGMLREELEELGILNPKPEKHREDETPPKRVPASPLPTATDAFLQAHASSEGGDEDADEDLIGDDSPLPDVGKRNSHPERKPKASAAQLMANGFKELMADEKQTFLQMIWPEARPIAEELGLPGLGKKPAKSAKLKAVG